MNASIPGKAISIEQLEAMFQNIIAKTKWDMDGKMLWGYFFTHHETRALELARNSLESEGYRFVDLYQSGPDDQDGPSIWWLHVEKEEIHTPKSLDARNNEHYFLAHRLGIDSYDGMDVGPIKP